MYDSITMDTSNLTWEEKVCCYFLREICEWLYLWILIDPRRKCFVVRNYRVDDDMATYLWEENWERDNYHNLLEVVEAVKSRGYTSDIYGYVEIYDWDQWDSKLQWCKIAKQFLDNKIVLDMLDNIKFEDLYLLWPTRWRFNIWDVLSLLRDLTIRDKKYLYIW